MTNRFLEKIAADQDKSDTSISGLRVVGKGLAGAGVGFLAGGIAGAKLAGRAIKRGATTFPRGIAFTQGTSNIGAGIGGALGAASSVKNQLTEKKASSNKYLEKISALAVQPETKNDLRDTGLIGATGIATGAVGAYAGKVLGMNNHVGKMALLSGGLGLVGDYAAVKAMKHLNNKQ